MPAAPPVVKLDKHPCWCLCCSHQSLRDFCVPKRSVVYAELFWTDIGTHSTKKILQMFPAGSKRKKKRMHLSEGEPHHLINPLQYSEVKIKEEIIYKNGPASQVCLSEDTMNELATLWKAVYPFCLLHDINFRMLAEEQEFEPGVALVVYVDFVLVDLLSNFKRVRDGKNCSHNLFACACMKAMLELCSKMLRPGPHPHIFCSVSQLGSGKKCFSRKLRCRRGLVGLVLILIEKKRRRRYRYFNWDRCLFTKRVLLVPTIDHLLPTLHSILILLNKSSTPDVWCLVRRKFWLSWVTRDGEQYPLRFHGGRTRWTISAAF